MAETDYGRLVLALECCHGAHGCTQCPYYEIKGGGVDELDISECTSELAFAALTFIREQAQALWETKRRLKELEDRFKISVKGDRHDGGTKAGGL